MDIGGIGFGPDGTDVFMEGIYIPHLKLAERGPLNETLMAMIRANTRLPVDTEGDVYSLAACNDVGCQRLVEMMERVRPRRPRRAGRRTSATRSRGGVLGRNRRACRRARGRNDDDGRRLRRAGDARRHHDGLAPAASMWTTPARARPSGRGINVPLAYTTAYTVFGLACIVGGAHPEQCRLAFAAHRLGAGGLRS